MGTQSFLALILHVLPWAHVGADLEVSDGPRVGNIAWKLACNESAQYFNFSTAEDLCDITPDCFAMHDYDCDGINWRICRASTIEAMVAYHPGTKACTKTVMHITPAPTPAPPTASVSGYNPGPHVSNLAYETYCNTQTFATLFDAKFVCDSTNCTALHDYDCNGQGWRTCTGTISELESFAADTLACTLIPTGPQTAVPLGFLPGGSVSNWAYEAYCQEGWFQTVEEAASACTASNCTALHDYDCNGQGWRVCTGSLAQLRQYAQDDLACLLVPVAATEGDYVDGPRVSNAVWETLCEEFTYSTLESAELTCNSDPACVSLHDYACDGELWRICHNTVETLMAADPGTQACTKIKKSAQLFIEGPHVPNAARVGHCTEGGYELEQAKELCANDPACSVIHDWGCDGKIWRVCTNITVAGMQELHEGTGACTFVKQDPCDCQESWMYEGTEHSGCSSTPDYANTWCYVAGGSSCADAHASTTAPGLYWKDCGENNGIPSYITGPRVANPSREVACPEATYDLATAKTLCDADPTCMGLHDYACDGELYRLCTSIAALVAYTGSPDTLACTLVKTYDLTKSFIDGPRVSNVAWREHCSTTYHELEDAEEACASIDSCHVIHDYNCDGNGWRFCHNVTVFHLLEEHPGTSACTKVTAVPDQPCKCMSYWTYHGESYSGCTMTPDYSNTWCYVTGGELCTTASESTIYPGLYWQDCVDPCGCMDSWTWDGQEYSGCVETPDTPQFYWCYVLGGADCAAASASTINAGMYWHECAEYERSHYTFGPRVSNVAWPDACFPETHTLAEAEAACDANPSCKALHDYACDGALYRVCTTLEAIMASPGTDTLACTKVRVFEEEVDHFVEGPHVGNGAWKVGCDNTTYTLDEAKAHCDADPSCKVIHDWDCDEKKWRVCHYITVYDLVNHNFETDACTMVWSEPAGPCDCADSYVWLGVTYSGCVETPDFSFPWCYVAGGSNCFDATPSTAVIGQSWLECKLPCACSDHWEWLGMNYSGCAETPDWTGHYWCYLADGSECPSAMVSTVNIGMLWHECAEYDPRAIYEEGPRVSNAAWKTQCSEEVYTLHEAEEACSANSTCSAIHDYYCDGTNWRVCHTIEELAHAANGSDACTRVTVTVTTTQVPITAYYAEGPRVSNDAWKAACQDNVTTFEEAAARCAADDFCTALHDWSCNGDNFRECSEIGPLQLASGDETPACTLILQDSCSCKQEWSYHGETYHGCDETPDYSNHWCYVVGGSKCATATMSSLADGMYWQDCTDPCECSATWEYDAVSHFGCSETPDYDHSWCYVSGGYMCIGSNPSEVKPGMYWKDCDIITTTTVTATGTGIYRYWKEGPHVANTAWLEHCNVGDAPNGQVSPGTYGSLAAAMEQCAASPTCSVIHDYNCNGNAYRICDAPIETILDYHHENEQACTIVLRDINNRPPVSP